MNYERISTVTAIVAVLLCLALLFFPDPVFSLLGVSLNVSSGFVGRRAAMVFLGISFICWLSRKSPANEARYAISFGVSVAMFALLALGAFELARGVAGKGILLVMVVEAILGTVHLKVIRS